MFELINSQDLGKDTIYGALQIERLLTQSSANAIILTERSPSISDSISIHKNLNNRHFIAVFINIEYSY